MKKLSALLLLSVSIFVLAIVACKKESEDTTTDNFDRKALLTNTADNVIIPAYTNFQAVFTEMKVAKEAFIALPDATTLAALRQKWKAAYVSWQQVELFNFGPAETISLRNYFNIYPTDVDLINHHLAHGTYNLEELANNKVQGFPALDYLINGFGANDNEILANYTTNAQAEKRKKYLSDVINIMDTKISQVLSDWKGSYRDQFVNNDGTGAGSSLSLMVNEYVMYFERFLRSGKFAIPAGVMSGTAAPEKVEALYSKDLGIELAKTALNACRDFYLGKAFNGGGTGPGLSTYLQALATNNTHVGTLATNIHNQFGVIENKMNDLGGSIYDAVVNNRPAVLALYDEFQKQVRYLKVDMTSAIGITISYTDNDGD